jgi:hypothetical protein
LLNVTTAQTPKTMNPIQSLTCRARAEVVVMGRVGSKQRSRIATRKTSVSDDAGAVSSCPSQTNVWVPWGLT